MDMYYMTLRVELQTNKQDLYEVLPPALKPLSHLHINRQLMTFAYEVSLEHTNLTKTACKVYLIAVGTAYGEHYCGLSAAR